MSFPDTHTNTKKLQKMLTNRNQWGKKTNPQRFGCQIPLRHYFLSKHVRRNLRRCTGIRHPLVSWRNAASSSATRFSTGEILAVAFLLINQFTRNTPIISTDCRRSQLVVSGALLTENASIVFVVFSSFKTLSCSLFLVGDKTALCNAAEPRGMKFRDSADIYRTLLLLKRSLFLSEKKTSSLAHWFSLTS